MEFINGLNLYSLLAIGLFGVGGWMAFRGVQTWIVQMRRPSVERSKLLVMVLGFRRAVIGLALVGIGLWLVTGQLWILIVALGVGGEELLESSFIIWTLRADERARPQTVGEARQVSAAH